MEMMMGDASIFPIGLAHKRNGTLGRSACPICRDKVEFLLWQEGPVLGCSQDEEWMNGRPRKINSANECPRIIQMNEAAAERRRRWPSAFDENGKIKPDGWSTIIKTAGIP